MATFGIVASKTVGDPFADRPNSWAKRTIRAIFVNQITRGREPADRAPITLQMEHGSTRPVQDFGFKSMATRANRPDLIVAASRGVPLAGNAVARRRSVV
jgi:hypothetical protein